MSNFGGVVTLFHLKTWSFRFVDFRAHMHRHDRLQPCPGLSDSAAPVLAPNASKVQGLGLASLGFRGLSLACRGGVVGGCKL